MSAYTTPQPVLSLAGLSARSMGAKFFVVLFLAVVMSIPGLFLNALADERAHEHEAATTAQATQAAHAPDAPQVVLGIRLADSYRSIHRSLRYITLFLGLVFLTYFVFEVTTGKRVHPGQYALVGVAQIIFYLLLLSLSEQIGFDLAFLVAGAATVALFSANANWVFRSRKLAFRALGVFTLLYAFIYVLLRLENYALLIGAFASFAAVAATMYATREIDWYSTTATPVPVPQPAGASHESWLL